MEQTFLDPEMDQLAMNFEQVIIVPLRLEGKPTTLPNGAQVEPGLALVRRSLQGKLKLVLGSVSSRLFYDDLSFRPASLFQPSVLARLAAFVGNAALTNGWVSALIKTRKLDLGKTVFYTYWLNFCSAGIGLAKRNHPQLKLISRAHGSDLYEERYRPVYLPCRRQTLAQLDGLFPDSEKGKEYIARRYSWFTAMCQTARLGVRDPSFLTPPSQDGVCRIVSCSLVVPVKRVDLLLKGIASAAAARPEQPFEWHHFGEGPLKSLVEETARNTLPANVKSYFPGYPSLDHLMSFYKNNPVDLFMNVSESEGTPVAVMEAISCGMPVAATGVGGNPEIASEQNGAILSPNPSPEEIGATILSFFDHPDQAMEKRKASRKIWDEKYNAARNFQEWVKLLESFAQ